MRFETLRQIDEAGFNVRLWCFRCARGDELDAIVWVHFVERGWAIDLAGAQRRFPCKVCRRSDAVAILTARRPREPVTWAAEVERFFHASRKGKRLFAVPKQTPRGSGRRP